MSFCMYLSKSRGKDENRTHHLRTLTLLSARMMQAIYDSAEKHEEITF